MIFTGIASLSIFSIANTIDAGAKKYVKTPTSLRGTWWINDSGVYQELQITKYHFHIKGTIYSDGISLYGNKFPGYAQGHAQLYIRKNSKGYYYIGAYASDEWSYWKRVKHSGRTAIRQYTNLPPNEYAVSYWYKYPKGTKPFHGYMIETKLYDLENTFYAKDTHCIISDYRPTQKSKVIFKKGSQVMPTHHEWDWFHGKDDNYLTDYHYKNGSWHKGSTTYVGD